MYAEKICKLCYYNFCEINGWKLYHSISNHLLVQKIKTKYICLFFILQCFSQSLYRILVNEVWNVFAVALFYNFALYFDSRRHFHWNKYLTKATDSHEIWTCILMNDSQVITPLSQLCNEYRQFFMTQSDVMREDLILIKLMTNFSMTNLRCLTTEEFLATSKMTIFYVHLKKVNFHFNQ